ncbi:MAG: type IV toxin-antitoxin system AbiEi family antitoxin domain-containing protein [Marmoricola sp.]
MTPDSFPVDIFTNADLARAGLTAKVLEHAIATGAVRRVLRGVYAPASVPDDLDVRARRR